MIRIDRSLDPRASTPAVFLLCSMATTACVPKERFVDEHCTVYTGNAWCEEQYGDARPFCANGCPAYAKPGNDGCHAERPDDDACYSPCGEERSILEDDSCLTAAGESSSSTTGTVESSESSAATETESNGSSESSESGVAACERDVDCGAEAPICGPDSMCTLCTAATDPEGSCSGRDPLAPVCLDDGTCVACTSEALGSCAGETPICNVETFVCERCDWHEQCPAADPSPASAGCNLETGACLPTKSVITVDGDAGSGADFSSLSAAIASVEAGTETTIIVHALDNDDPYLGGLTLTGPRTIALLAAPDEAPIIQGTAGNPGLSLSGGATVFVQGLHVRQGNGLGVRIDGPETIAYIDRTHVVLNTGGGIEVLSGASVTLRSSVVSGPVNGSAVRVMGSTLDILYSTLGNSTFNTIAALTCDATSTVTVRNSVVTTQGGANALACAPATFITSFVADDDTTPPFDATWFANYDGGNFSLPTPFTTDHPFVDAAVWLRDEHDPLVDIDGDPRPVGKDTQDIAGADVPTP